MISIIIPVYNVERYLSMCLDSCFRQSYSDIEVLAVNDGSTDKSGAILDEYALHEPRLRVFHQKNQGVVTARNIGIDVAQGEWVMFVDSDDYLTPDALTILYEYALKEDLDIAMASIQLLWKDNSIQIIQQPSGLFDNQQYFNHLLSARLIWGPIAKLFRKELFEKCSLEIPSDIAIGEDLMMNLFLSIYATKIGVINKPIYVYRKVSGSAVFRLKFGLEYWKKYIQILQTSLASVGIQMDTYAHALMHFKVNLSFHMLSGGIKIKDKGWRNNILQSSLLKKDLSYKETITLMLLKYPCLQPLFYFFYKKIVLRKL